MNNNLKTILISLATAIAGYLTGTNLNPSINFDAVGADVTVSLMGTKACVNIHKQINAQSVSALLDSLTAGVGTGENLKLKVVATADGNFLLSADGCIETKQQ